jgi:hypothetical protein
VPPDHSGQFRHFVGDCRARRWNTRLLERGAQEREARSRALRQGSIALKQGDIDRALAEFSIEARREHACLKARCLSIVDQQSSINNHQNRKNHLTTARINNSGYLALVCRKCEKSR